MEKTINILELTARHSPAKLFKHIVFVSSKKFLFLAFDPASSSSVSDKSEIALAAAFAWARVKCLLLTSQSS